ncbi:HEAT repeat-containing protein 3 [Aplysia californica]|uniref:HEAT repeat-containing protein 3 n=1 Tax=Aplysia californica TaxID=6500 RepID=A0ABM0K7G5_APLCA|nr:HEAT repeat-containing protein 3 [Aplysia californica]
MGKSRTKRFSAIKHNPTGLLQGTDLGLDLPDDQNENGSSQSCNDISSFVTNIVDKLQSASSEDRACGCQMLTRVESQPRAVEYLLQQNIVRIICPLFLDSSSEVQINALGAVRNICIHGNESVCSAVVASDVLTPLTALIKQYDNTWTARKESGKCGSSSDVLIQAVELFTILCENNAKAVTVFNKENLLMLLLPMLKVETYSYDLSCAVAQCLHVVSENNPDVTAVCQDHEVQSTLFHIACGTATEIDAILFRTLVTGIVLNFSEAAVSPYHKVIVKNLSDVLDIDYVPVLKTALEKQQQAAENEMYSEEGVSSGVDKLLRAQGVCLELLANLCCTDDDEWEDMEMDCQGSEESSDDQALEEAGACQENSADGNMESLCLSTELHSSFMENNVLSKIMQKTLPVECPLMEQMRQFRWGKVVQTKLNELQSRGLLCLSNVVSALDAESLSTSPTPLSSIWTNVHKLAALSQSTHGSDEDHKWAVTSAMRAVIQRMAEFDVSNVGEVSTADLESMVNIGVSSKSRETQINVLRIISTIGCILSAQTPPHVLLTRIGFILCEVACNNEDVVVMAEALDSLFDVFKEDHTDAVVREIGLVDKLRSLQSSFKSKVSGQRKKLGENYGVVMMAKANLAGFIKYKTSQH